MTDETNNAVHTAGGDTDLPPGDRLLGLRPGSLFEARAMRGFGMLVLALVILLWPDRTDRALAVLVGIGLVMNVSMRRHLF